MLQAEYLQEPFWQVLVELTRRYELWALVCVVGRKKIDLTRTNATHVRNSPVRKRNSIDFVANVMRDQTLKSITC
jgi:hypothetical protein